jgi:hypothetical protein
MLYHPPANDSKFSGSNVVLECCDLMLPFAASGMNPHLSRSRPRNPAQHNPNPDFSLAVFTRLLSTHTPSLLTETCNGHEHLLPLRSSHVHVFEPPRERRILMQENRDRTEESGRISSIPTAVSS